MLEWKHYLPHIRSTLERFTEEVKNSQCFEKYDSTYIEKLNEQKESLLTVFNSLDTEEEAEAVEDYIDFCVNHELPYLLIVSELSNIAREILGLLGSEAKCAAIPYTNDLFKRLEYKISEGYYQQFLRKLSIKHHLRLSHLSHLIEKHLMIHYQHHLEWMLVLISKIQGIEREGAMCELDHKKCSFGKWLHNPSLPYLSSTSYFTDIQRLHIALHELASNIMAQHTANGLDYKNMIQLLQRLDYASLEIGNEIAIINDMLLIGEYTKDSLTGLLGRRLFEKIVMGQIEIAKATENECTLMMCDLDHFKEINDKYGHLAGDEVIKSFAELLKQSLRKSDFIFRFGGEEFIVLLPSTNYKQTFSLAERICEEAALQKVTYNGFNIPYTVSIGVSKIDIDDLSFVTKDTIQKYVHSVDAKLYLAKQNGRNRVE